jgi:hypothetical protein
LCLLDDVLLCKVLLEMEPKQMTILGSVSGLFNLSLLLGTSNLKIFITFYSIFLISENCCLIILNLIDLPPILLFDDRSQVMETYY